MASKRKISDPPVVLYGEKAAVASSHDRRVGMSEDLERRQIIENRLGKAFAAKATRALIRALTEPIVIAEAVRGVRETAVTGSEADVIHPPVILEVATASTDAALAEGTGHARQLAIASARAAFERRSAEIRERLQLW